MDLARHATPSLAVRVCLAWIAVSAVLVASGCSPHTSDPVVLTGSSTIAPMASDIAREFERRHPGTRVDVQTGGSSRGLSDARKGTADIGMVSRDLGPAEDDLVGFPIAVDGVCMIAHESNPVRELGRDQIVAIYTGELTRWNDVGGNDAPITVVNKAEGRSTLEVFLKHFELESSQIRAQVVIGDNEHGIKSVGQNPDAVGYVSIGSAEQAIERGVPIRMLALGGVAPSTDALRDGRFPIRRTLNLVTSGAPEGLVREFIEFFQSPEARAIIERNSFVPLDPR
ncbi:MAG: phosphate ABC transporter substrate-binding protein [Planctomycetes bacterium]|nr:phosphate ABC transporter substrate-binding protein [Planctomycetota bacterium]